ncbi:uncharacterized protein LOC101858098 [Aplysia californica]|uniref:Uncharacterized protein LOC101858098 n=1 Tax=Aplysia californica TaxID=6500 RepID=A0ABM1VRG0_APLCA|nr:uncharacterized protein LOC101858098 [Aplysia californica]
MQEGTDDPEKDSDRSELCGKSYKAKRSLHQHHQNTHHKDLGKMLPPAAVSSLPTQVPLHSALLAQQSPTPAISEATKSLLRETLESSRKAKDSSSSSNTSQISSADTLHSSSSSNGGRLSDRLSTPNLVNLLTSDISHKGHAAAASDGAVALLKNKSRADGIKKEGELMMSVKTEMVEEEQAEDLSVRTTAAKNQVKVKRSPSVTADDKKVHCEFCHKSFKHDVSLANHIRTAHNIIVNFPESQPAPQPPKLKQNRNTTSYARIEPKPNGNPLVRLSDVLPNSMYATDGVNKLDPVAADLTISSLLARKVMERPNMMTANAGVGVAESSAGAGGGGAVLNGSGVVNGGLGSVENGALDESNALPYHVTSRMVQDLSLEELSSREPEKQAVLAEDGGQRRSRITVLKETVLVSRLDGINNVTGRQATAFQCQLCKRAFTSLVRLYHHLPNHFDSEVNTFDCRYCEASFRLQTQILKHLQCHKDKFSGLSNVSLPLEDIQKKQKDQSSDNVTPASSGSNSSFLSPGYLADNSLTNTPITGRFPEPGERANGGYSCTKCRKSFSREYLLQRHMRIHQNQNSFWCPDCESGFSGETDLMEHRRACHGTPKVSDEQMKYSNLLNSLSASVYDQSAAAAAAAVAAAAQSSKLVVANSDSNNNNSSGNDNNNLTSATAAAVAAAKSGLPASTSQRLGLYPPMVDMKAIDLRHGEEVAVRMAAEVGDAEREMLARQAVLQEFQKKALLMKAMEAQTDKRTAGTGLDFEQLKKTFPTLGQKQLEAVTSRILQENEKMRLALLKAASEEEQRQRKMFEKLSEKKRREEQEAAARLLEEEKRRRQLEQEKLKEKLAQEGMGDVTVVMPDAPPSDSGSGDDGDARAGAGQVEEETETAVDFSTTSSSLRKSEGVVAVAAAAAAVVGGGGGDGGNVVRCEAGKAKSEGGAEGKDTGSETAVSAGVKRRSPVPITGSAPPTKSRRKALKPQRINHCEEETGTSPTSETPTPGGDVGVVKMDTDQADESSSSSPAHTAESSNKNKFVQIHPAHFASNTLSQLNQLASIGAIGLAPATPLSELARKQLAAAVTSRGGMGSLVVTPSGLKYMDKAIPGYDQAALPMLFGSMSGGQILNASSSSSNGGSINNNNNSSTANMAIDLSTTDSGGVRQGGAKPSVSSPPPSNYETYMREMNLLSSAPSSSSTAAPGQATDLSQKSSSGGKKKSSKSSLSRSNSHEVRSLTEGGDHSSQDLLAAAATDLSKTSLLNVQIPSLSNPTAASAVLLSKLAASQLSGLEVDPDNLVGYPRVQWKQQMTATELAELGMLVNGSAQGFVKDGKAQPFFLNTNSNSNSSNKSQASSPSPAPSPTNSDASSSAEGRKVTTTSLSRTHSRLCVVNEPVDRNALCKPKVLDDGRQVFSCAICHKNFLSLSDINRHMDFHEDIRPYKCKYCDYYARTNSQLKVHKLRHEGVREFCCRICNYKGVTQSDLNRHMKSQVHVLRSQNVCERCGEGFVTPRNLEEHQASLCCGSPDKNFLHDSKANDEDLDEDHHHHLHLHHHHHMLDAEELEEEDDEQQQRRVTAMGEEGSALGLISASDVKRSASNGAAGEVGEPMAV